MKFDREWILYNEDDEDDIDYDDDEDELEKLYEENKVFCEENEDFKEDGLFFLKLVFLIIYLMNFKFFWVLIFDLVNEFDFGIDLFMVYLEF